MSVCKRVDRTYEALPEGTWGVAADCKGLQQIHPSRLVIGKFDGLYCPPLRLI